MFMSKRVTRWWTLEWIKLQHWVLGRWRNVRKGINCMGWHNPRGGTQTAMSGQAWGKLNYQNWIVGPILDPFLQPHPCHECIVARCAPLALVSEPVRWLDWKVGTTGSACFSSSWSSILCITCTSTFLQKEGVLPLVHWSQEEEERDTELGHSSGHPSSWWRQTSSLLNAIEVLRQQLTDTRLLY